MVYVYVVSGSSATLFYLFGAADGHQRCRSVSRAHTENAGVTACAVHLRARRSSRRTASSESRALFASGSVKSHTGTTAVASCGRVRANRKELEARFMDRLRALQPNPAYMLLFNAIVRDVWKAQEADARKAREHARAALDDVERREHLLNSAFIYEKRIDEKTYAGAKRQAAGGGDVTPGNSDARKPAGGARLGGPVGIRRAGSDERRAHVVGGFARATHAPSSGFLPQGLAFDGERFGTAATCLAFSELRQIRGDENGVASPGVDDIFHSGTIEAKGPPVFDGGLDSMAVRS